MKWRNNFEMQDANMTTQEMPYKMVSGDCGPGIPMHQPGSACSGQSTRCAECVRARLLRGFYSTSFVPRP